MSTRSRYRIYILSPLPNLLQHHGVLNLFILGKEYNLGHNLCSLRILIHKWKEQLASLLAVNRKNMKHGSALLMYHAASQMNGVVGPASLNQGVAVF